MTTCDNRGADDGGMKTMEPMVATIVATVVAPATTPPPLTVMPATPRGPLYLDPWTGTIQMCLILGGGGRRPTASPIGHAGRCSHLRSSSIAG
jgi:hypothetical protein